MDLLPTDEQEAIAAAARDLLAAHGYPAALRELPADGVDRRLWGAAADLGWLALGAPEGAGGLGLASADEAMLFRELGRALAPGPFLATTLAVHVAAVAGDLDTCAGLASGRLTAVLALVTGSQVQVLGPGAAPLAVAVGPDGVGLVDTTVLGRLEPRACIDASTPLWHAGAVAPPVAGYLGVRRRGRLLVAATLVGIAEATRDLATAHALAREQFGQPIGAFQAVKHRCADMAVRAEAAWAQVRFAAAAAAADADDGADPDREVASALLVALGAARRNAASCIQVHGGLGFTAEHVAHRYVTRTHVLEHAVGSRRDHLAAVLAAT